MRQFLGYALLSLGAGALYAFVASGIVLVQRGSGVLNFAQGAFLALSAYLFEHARTSWGLSSPLAGLFAVGVTALVGLCFYLLVLRPMRQAALINRVMATLGLLIILSEFISLTFGSATRAAPNVLPRGSLTIFHTLIGDHIFYRSAVIGAIALSLWAFFRWTTPGLATAAVAENADAASTLGWSPDVVAGVSWLAGAAISAIGGVLLAPFQLDATNLVLLIVPALAVALIGNFRNFPLVLFGSFALALTELEVQVQLVNHDPQGLRGLDKIVPLAIIVVFLVIRGRSIPDRGFVAERRPELGSGRINISLVVVALGIGLALIWGPLPVVWINAVATNASYGLIVLSLVVVVGLTGQLSLGQVAFAGVGALVAGRLMAVGNWHFGPALIIGVIAAMPVGLAFALPALRTRGLQFAVVSLGLAVAINELLFQRPYFSPAPPGGPKHSIYSSVIARPEGTIVANSQTKGPLSLFGITIDQSLHPERYATFCLVLFVVVGLLVAQLRRSAAGRRLIAVRTNERAAAALGVHVAGAKLFAFGLSAAIAALGGILFAFTSSNVVYDQSFVPLQSIIFIAFAVVGGIGYVSGAFVGAALGPQALGARIGAWVSDQLASAVSALKLIIVGLAGLLGFSFGRGVRNNWRNERRQFAPLVGVIVFVVIGVLFAGRARSWLGHLDRYLPMIGGLVLLNILVTSGGRGFAGMASRRYRPVARRLRRSDSLTRVEGLLQAVEGDQHHTLSRAHLRVNGLTVRFGGVTAAEHVSFEVPAGQVIGLIGPNGAGKTTIVDAITGYSKPSSGSVVLDGSPLDGRASYQRARAGVSRSFQNLELFDDLTVLENIRAASDSRASVLYFSSLFGWRDKPLTATAIAAVRQFGLEDDLLRRVDDLPYGRRRLVAIARAVAARPSILLLDEPAAGLDEAESAGLARLTRRLAVEWGLGVLVIEHDMTFVMDVCDRVVVLDFGQKIAEGAPAEIQRNPAVLAAYLGTPADADSMIPPDAKPTASTAMSEQP